MKRRTPQSLIDWMKYPESTDPDVKAGNWDEVAERIREENNLRLAKKYSP